MRETLNRPAGVRRLVALAGVAALLYAIAGCSNPPSGLKSLAKGEMAKLKVTDHPEPAPATVFTDATGKGHTLAEFKGKVAVVNLWATWCAPCVTEIPHLAALKAAYVGKPVEVAAISLDKGEDIALARSRIARNAPLTFYSEPTYHLPYELKPMVQDMPTTIIYDRRGVERARMAGGADWSGKDAKAVVDTLLAEAP
jgi:thiol-disulfide isomerase/thioredoxin